MRDWATRQCTALDFYLSGRRFCRQTGVTAYLPLCLCGCARTLTWLFVLTTDSSSISFSDTCAASAQTAVAAQISVFWMCVCFLCHRAHLSLVCTAATKAGFVPLLPPPLLSVQPAPFKHVTVAASPQAGLIIPRPGPARHVCTSGLRAILCVLDTKM